MIFYGRDELPIMAKIVHVHSQRSSPSLILMSRRKYSAIYLHVRYLQIISKQNVTRINFRGRSSIFDGILQNCGEAGLNLLAEFLVDFKGPKFEISQIIETTIADQLSTILQSFRVWCSSLWCSLTLPASVVLNS